MPGLSIRATAELLALTAELIYNANFSRGLTPAQWSALRFFATASSAKANLMSYARHHGKTRGTASRTISRLVDKGLVTRHQHPFDGRQQVIELSQRGSALLEEDPIASLTAFLSNEDEATLDVTSSLMARLLEEHFHTKAPEVPHEDRIDCRCTQDDQEGTGSG